jgi:protein TonB
MRIFTIILAWGVLLPLSGWAQIEASTRKPTTSEAPTLTAPVAAVLNYAEQMPVFAGGAEALHRYLVTATKYPAAALRRGLSGTVTVQFIVDEQGRVLDPVVVKTTDEEFSAEAIRLVWLMPWWTPGRQGGQPVRVRCTLPIAFTFKR